MRENIVILAASNGSCFTKERWQNNIKCRWISGARTKSRNLNKTLDCLIGQALKLDHPKAVVVYADIPLNSLTNKDRPFDKDDWQSPEQIAESLLQTQQLLEQSGVVMLTMTGRRPARGDNPEIFLKDALQKRAFVFLGLIGQGRAICFRYINTCSFFSSMQQIDDTLAEKSDEFFRRV